MARSQRINFRRSSICWNHGTNKSHGLFNVEAILRIYNDDNLEELFALGTGVLAGNVYALNQLVKKPAYFFQIAASNERHVVFRTYTQAQGFSWKPPNKRGREGDTYGDNQLFESLLIDLDSEEGRSIKVHDDVNGNCLLEKDFSCLIKIPLKSKRKLELEFPVKHFNFLPDSKKFQVETGPVLFVRPECLYVEKKDLWKELVPSFIHFNCYDRADFTLDFPYGARESSRRGKMTVSEVNCEIQLWVADPSRSVEKD